VRGVIGTVGNGKGGGNQQGLQNEGKWKNEWMSKSYGQGNEKRKTSI